jgi:hypothetical protein
MPQKQKSREGESHDLISDRTTEAGLARPDMDLEAGAHRAEDAETGGVRTRLQ